ncbi:MAG: RdgB/HAM1 family non-canonical purine NTP pyrophosphatase [Ekhidna sp.]|uniref:RdgB/HAM1 family non-canonical purine NTP pyrophosphatase n=1 Tax=Ekhidna sp. TaxID=2608089 RepID=UPI0032EE4102
MQICFASHNENKVKEIGQMVPDGLSVVGLYELGITEEIAETGTSIEENSQIKASYVFERKHIPVFADDSGLVVKSLGGEPGVYSARYAGEQRDDDANMDLLLSKLQDKADRSAEFQTVITLIDQRGDSHQFKGVIEGTIHNTKRGTNGFGYDPIFIPKGYDKTFAELPLEEKNRISHRAKAVQKLLEYLHQINE